jgi:hypothetical protein
MTVFENENSSARASGPGAIEVSIPRKHTSDLIIQDNLYFEDVQIFDAFITLGFCRNRLYRVYRPLIFCVSMAVTGREPCLPANTYPCYQIVG